MQPAEHFVTRLRSGQGAAFGLFLLEKPPMPTEANACSSFSEVRFFSHQTFSFLFLFVEMQPGFVGAGARCLS